jgi:hypothetical protein
VSVRTGRIHIRASQLEANDFPPVCAMTGRSAETWRKLRFYTPPAWFHLLVLSFGTLLCTIGIALYLIAWFVWAPKASGYLPLTRGSALRLNAAFWISIALWPLAVVMIAIGLVVGNTLEPVRSQIGWWILIAGGVTIVPAVASLFVRPLFGPGARVHKAELGQSDRLVELKRLHPVFVEAVRQMKEVSTSAASIAPGVTS